MNPALALIIWFFVIIIVFFIVWYFAGYTVWQSLAAATLASLIVLIILFPWDFENRRHRGDGECDNFGKTGFYIIVGISIIILVAYIITTYFWNPIVVPIVPAVPIVAIIN